MQEIIERILEGDFDYESGSLDFSCAKLELTLMAGTVCEGSFRIISTPGCFTAGRVGSSDLRMECLTPEFSGSDEEIAFRFHGEHTEEGDVVKGSFYVISNHGEYYLPFVVSVEHTVLQSSIGAIKNLFHFANLAKSSWQEAVKLFYLPEFSRILTGSDAQYRESYRGLSVYPGKEQNVEEFLIRINKKQKVEFLAQEQRLECRLASSDSAYAVSELAVNLVRNGWGYTLLHVECEGDFVFTEKEVLGDDDFLGNCCRLPVFVDRNACRRGRNFGYVRLYNSYISLEIPVVADMGEDAGAARMNVAKCRQIVELMEYYQAFRLKKISTGTWLKETRNLVERLVSANEYDVAARLFQAQLLITEERYNEADWVLENAWELMESMGLQDDTLEAYYLYLTTLINRDEAYVNQVAAQVQHIYKKDHSRWQAAWLLLYLSEEYGKASVKWQFLEKQFLNGCSSPVLYIEALQLVNANPSLLRKLDRYELQVLYYGVKHGALEAETVEQLLYLAGKRKDYSRMLERILERLYGEREDERILQEICALLIRGGKVGKEYFPWYQRGVDAQLRITNLYEYYMMSVDLEADTVLPKRVLLYFSYQNQLDYERCACLFSYVYRHRDDFPEIYEAYQPKMERFIIEQIQKEHTGRFLAMLYRDILTPEMVNEQTAGHLSRLLFVNRIWVADSRIKKVFVYTKGSLEPREYLLQDGQAWISLYGNDYTILFEDAWKHRFAKNVECTLEKLMLPSRFIQMAAGYVQDNPEFDLYYYENFIHELHPDNVECVVRVVDSGYAEKPVRREAYLKLLQYFYDGDELQALDRYLDQLPMQEASLEFSMEERSRLLKIMVLRGRYREAYQWLVKYGPYFADEKTLVRLITEIMHQENGMAEATLAGAALHAFRQGKYNSDIIRYLTLYYRGMTKNMRDIWKAARSFGVDCYELSENILVQMLYSGAFVGEKMEIFNYYISQGAKSEVEAAFLAQCSYDYFVNEKVTEQSVFRHIQNMYRRGEPLQWVCKLAFLQYYAENRQDLEKGQIPLIQAFLQEMFRKKIHLNFFREYKDYVDMTWEMMDKTIIEYRVRPGGRAKIHYILMNEEEGTGGRHSEYRSEYMQDVYGGVCFKEFILFFGESLQYYIMEENDGEEQLTESGSLQRSDFLDEAKNSRYALINDMLISRNLQDYDTLDALLEEYGRREFFVSRLFQLR